MGRIVPNYRRYYVLGGSYFFTVVTADRCRILTSRTARDHLRAAFAECRERWPFRQDGLVILPDHLHALWTMPEDDPDFSRRWSTIKQLFTQRWLADGGPEAHPPLRDDRRRGVWQQRFWEHRIRDDRDVYNHLDYIHYNPVKHGLVSVPRDWPFSTFRRLVRRGWYDAGWGAGDDAPTSVVQATATAKEPGEFDNEAS